MKIALLTTDNRAMFRHYEKEAPWFGTAPEALLQGFAGLPGVEVHVVSCTQQPMKSPAMLAENIYFHSLHVSKIGWMRTGYQGCIRAVRRKLREIRPDIVHGQGTERDCAISAVFSGYPNVLTIHGKMTEIAKIARAPFFTFHGLAARLENFTLPRTDGIICISTYVENRVRSYGVPLWLIPNALRRAFFEYPRAAQDRKIPQLINVGVIGKLKGQRQLLSIFRALRAEGLDFETIFVGSADSASAYATDFARELSAAQTELGKFSHVLHLGTEELCGFFDISSALVHFSAEESFGLVFGEALARNLHLFASNVGGIQDLSRGVPGVEIFSPHDWEGLKNALRHWLSTNAFQLPKPATSPEALVRRYHPVEVARQHLQVYRDTLDRLGRAPV
jgi:glycosyltransferase involved in cell wall biosynthesis